MATTTAVADQENLSSRGSTVANRAGPGRAQPPPAPRCRRLLVGAGLARRLDRLGRIGARALRCRRTRHPAIVGCQGARWRPSSLIPVLTVDEGDEFVGEMSEAGRLMLLGAPLGNPADASARLREVLRQRRHRRRRGHPPAEPARPRPRHHRRRSDRLLLRGQRGAAHARTGRGACSAGHVVALVTDGGMPSVSDPGYRLVRAALDGRGAGHRRARAERGHHRPGPLRAALRPVLLRGLPAPQGRRPPGPAGARWPPSSARWSSSRPRTGSAATLTDLAAAFGADRPAALCRELTKTYEEVRRGRSASWPSGPPRASRAARSPWSWPARRRPPPERPDDETCARRSPSGRPPACPAGTRSPTSPPSTGCAAGTSTRSCTADRCGAAAPEAAGSPGGGEEAEGDQRRAGDGAPPRPAAVPAAGQQRPTRSTGRCRRRRPAPPAGRAASAGAGPPRCPRTRCRARAGHPRRQPGAGRVCARRARR